MSQEYAVEMHGISKAFGNKIANSQVELTLKKYIPAEEQADAHHWLLLHGRYICQSRTPHCELCPFDSFCPKQIEGSKINR